MSATPKLNNIDGAGEVDEPALDISDPIVCYKAHWHIFVPTIVISILYLFGWLVLYFMGMANGAIARLFVVVLSVGVPLLFAHAFLRYQTISICIFKNCVQYHTGWPKAEPIEMPYGLIKNVRFTRGLSGRMFGGGTVVISTLAGEPIAVADVANPIEAVAKIIVQKA